jgi:hypothetical protein
MRTRSQAKDVQSSPQGNGANWESSSQTAVTPPTHRSARHQDLTDSNLLQSSPPSEVVFDSEIQAILARRIGQDVFFREKLTAFQISKNQAQERIEELEADNKMLGVEYAQARTINTQLAKDIEMRDYHIEY